MCQQEKIQQERAIYDVITQLRNKMNWDIKRLAYEYVVYYDLNGDDKNYYEIVRKNLQTNRWQLHTLEKYLEVIYRHRDYKSKVGDIKIQYKKFESDDFDDDYHHEMRQLSQSLYKDLKD